MLKISSLQNSTTVSKTGHFNARKQSSTSLTYVRVSVLGILYWVALCSALVFAACTAGEQKSGAAKVDACTVVVKSDAAAVLGEPVKDAEHGILEHEGDDSSADISHCVYRAVADGSGKSVELMIRHAPFDENTPESIDQVRKAVEQMGKTPQAIDGIGDTTFWDGETLHTFQGARYYLMISVRGLGNESAALEQAKMIAQKTLNVL
ncbi:MAG: hypothetical protein U0175_07485 [Caldilineaceae bacterium]